MEKSISRFTKIGCAVVVGMLISHRQTALAGWTCTGNAATGIGYASVNVRSVTLVLAQTNSPGNIASPNASCPPTNGYLKASIALPDGASTTTPTYVKCSGGPGIIFTGSKKIGPGDGGDHPEFEARLGDSFIPAEDCAELNMVTSNVYDPVTGSGTITVKTKATAGTALWLRGFEYTGEPALVPIDDPNTPPNETIEFFKLNGVRKFETILLGPYDFSGENGACALLVPYNVKDLNNLYVTTDGLGKSIPLTITCPNDAVVFTCSGPADYPVTTTGGCGNVTLSYSTPASSIGATLVHVTATATDQAGNTATCTFDARRSETLVFDGFYSPIGIEGTDCNKVFKNSELTRLGQVIPIKFKTFCNGVNLSSPVPTYFIQKCIFPPPPNPVIVKTGSFVFVSNEWHGQFDTGEQGITTGLYVIHVVLQDGTTRQIAVKLK